MKRLIWDIETSPNVVLSWRTGYKINIDHDNILHERAIICIGYKWHGKKGVHSLQWDKNQSDRELVLKFAEIANEADELVAHNGDCFDLPWLRTRALLHGVRTDPFAKTIDTLQWARRKFLFNSNRLDYIARFLGFGGKIKTEFGLWKDVVLRKDAAALKRMVDYCKRDVELLEKVYDRLADHVPAKTHIAVLAGGDKWHCPHCGGKNVSVDRRRVTATGITQWRFVCNDDKRVYLVSDKAHSQYLAYKADKNGKRIWTAEESATAQKLRKSGLNSAQIAKQMGRTTNSVQNHLSRL